MWLSFFSNILIFVVALFLAKKFNTATILKHFQWFILATGFSALVGAFGHLPLLSFAWQGILLFISRVINVAAIWFFTQATIIHFHSPQVNAMGKLNNMLFALSLVWLVYLNYLYPGFKLSFKPVMVYGIVGIVGLGMLHYVFYFNRNRTAYKQVILGILILAVSALIFKILPEGTGIKPSDISHLFIAISLVAMANGFNQLTK
jgi:hypothetical protein